MWLSAMKYYIGCYNVYYNVSVGANDCDLQACGAAVAVHLVLVNDAVEAHCCVVMSLVEQDTTVINQMQKMMAPAHG